MSLPKTYSANDLAQRVGCLLMCRIDTAAEVTPLYEVGGGVALTATRNGKLATVKQALQGQKGRIKNEAAKLSQSYGMFVGSTLAFQNGI